MECGVVKREWIKKKPVESGRREVEKAKNSGFGVRGHPKHWGAEGSKAKKTALGSEVEKAGVRGHLRECECEGEQGFWWRVAGGELRVAGVLKIGKRKKPGDEGKSTMHFQVGDFFHLPHFTFQRAC